jgi:catechol 2,3-dioxygenase-like lactoylglutathione lyase family enzyme
MPELRRLAIGAENPGRLAAFYQDACGLEKIDEQNGAVFLSDGTFNLALVPVGDSVEAGLRYLGFESARGEIIKEKVANTEHAKRIKFWPVGDPDIEYEIRDPDGIVIGLSKRAFDTSYSQGPAPIRHIALFTPNPQRLRDFYCEVLGMKEVERTDRSSIFVSDGYISLALLFQRAEEPQGLNHFGFHVKSNDEMRQRVEKAGVREGAKRPDRIPFAEYRLHDPEGNGFDISEKGWKV